MIRILHITGTMNYGGIETFIMNLYRNIDKTKIQFDFLVPENKIGKYDEEIKALGGKLYELPERRDGIIKYKKALKNFFKEHKEYNCVHMHVSSLTNIMPIKIAKKYGVKKRFLHAHNTYQKGIIHNILNKINKINLKRNATRLFACSKEAGIYNFGNNNFEIIKNGINAPSYIFDKEKRKIKRKELEIDGDTLAIVNIGRFSEQKNHTFLLDIFKEYTKQNNKAKLYLIGAGELEEQIKDKINKLKINDKVVMLGLRNDIPDVLQAMDVFLFPSLYEGLGIVAIEAQASGIQCFMSDVIPKETEITNLAIYISLNKTAEQWAQVLNKKIDTTKRLDTYCEVKKFGYDIKNTLDVLEKYYLEG